MYKVTAPHPTSARKVSTIRALNWSTKGFPSMQQQQQHKLYLHDYNYVITVLQKLQHKVTIYNKSDWAKERT